MPGDPDAKRSAFIATPAETYSGAPRSADAQAQLRNLETRMMQLFSREDANALQPNGPCQPKIIK